MGHEIFYCCRCAIRVGSADLENGRAYRVDGKIVCAECLTAAEKHALVINPPSRAQSTSRIRMIKPGTSTKLPQSRPNAPPPSRTPLLIGLSAGALVLVGGAFWAMTGSTPPDQPPIVRPPDPPPRKPIVEDPPKEKPEEPQLKEAREAMEAARAKSKSAPADLEAQRVAWDLAAR